MTDIIKNPPHYAQAAVSLEPIDVVRYAPFCLGNALKYIIRAGHKGDKKTDLLKAKQYLEWVMEDDDLSMCSAHRKFFERYGALLFKFKVFQPMADACCFTDFLERLRGYVDNALAKATVIETFFQDKRESIIENAPTNILVERDLELILYAVAHGVTKLSDLSTMFGVAIEDMQKFCTSHNVPYKENSDDKSN